MQVFVFDLHGSSQGIDCFRPSEIFSDGLNFPSLSQVVGMEESDVSLLGKNT
jgi:hypothetical protein